MRSSSEYFQQLGTNRVIHEACSPLGKERLVLLRELLTEFITGAEAHQGTARTPARQAACGAYSQELLWRLLCNSPALGFSELP